ncbi:phosphoribosylglycinamide formyltransferase [Flagellimonas sp. DF-77]|uniref:phosphoribosylglycinamide formyltransferase n=1 Tax=Flagellimonas algarum TaxID=3230298 RepID=UPI00339710EB
MKKIVLFASGSGSNVENIIRFFNDDPSVTITCVLTNNPKAKVLERCKRLEVPTLCFDRNAFSKSSVVQDFLGAIDPHLIVLAGFLWKVPEAMVAAFPQKIINIHPALLPQYGGKGMYGENVHRAVKDSGDTETGITIHYVNEAYDEGAIIEQVRVAVDKGDSIETIAAKVHELEYNYYPKVIAELLDSHG